MKNLSYVRHNISSSYRNGTFSSEIQKSNINRRNESFLFNVTYHATEVHTFCIIMFTLLVLLTFIFLANNRFFSIVSYF